ncbi:MAG: fibronectin type III domain-containing protein [Nocardioidaceae bacterium]
MNGYVPSGGEVAPVVPARLLETREGPDDKTVDGLFEGIGEQSAGAVIELDVAGRGGVPDDASAVFLNVTAVWPEQAGFLTVYPCGANRPLASNVNFQAGAVVPNAVVAKVGDGGKVCIFTVAATHIVVDVNGYVPSGGGGGSVAPPPSPTPTSTPSPMVTPTPVPSTAASPTPTPGATPTPLPSLLAAPTGLATIAGDREAALMWSPTLGTGVRYHVLQAADPDGPYTARTTTPIAATNYTADDLTNDTVAWFRVYAVDSAGRRSPDSTPASAVPSTSPPPASVTKVAYPGGSTTLTTGRFAARVPAGTVDVPTAVTLTPLPNVEGELPSVDVHIHGAWNPVAGGIDITLPGPADPALTPIVLHHAANGLEVTSGDFLAVAGTGPTSSVTVNATELSVFDRGEVDCDIDGDNLLLYRIGCGNLKAVDPTEVFRQRAEQALRELEAMQQTSHECSGEQGAAAAVGTLGRGIACDIDVSGDLAVFTFENRDGDEGSIADFLELSVPTVYMPQIEGGDFVGAVTQDDVPWVLHAFDWLTPGPDLVGSAIVPGGGFWLRKTSNPHETHVTWSVDGAGTFQALFAQFVLGQLVDDLLDLGEDELAAIAFSAGCIGGTPDVEDLLGCAKSAVLTAAERALSASPTGKAIVFAVKVGVAAHDLWDAFTTAPPTTYLINSDPFDPPYSSRPSKWIGRNPDSGRSVYVDDGVARPIVDAGTFACLAESVFVWDVPNLRVLREATAEPAECATTPLEPWNVQPPPDGNVGDNVLLRSDDGNSSWLINSNSEIQAVGDGGVYECLAYTNPVVWKVGQSAIDAWEPVGTTDASCGGSIDELPDLEVADFRQSPLGNEFQVVGITSKGWWLTRNQHSTPYPWMSYEWTGPDGTGGQWWQSAFWNISAAAGANGELFVHGYDMYDLVPRNEVVLRVGSDGFTQLLDVGHQGVPTGNVVLGADDNLYWSTSDAAGAFWIYRIDPVTLAITGKVAASAVTIHSSEVGLIANQSGTTWTVPYDEFDDDPGEIGESSAPLLSGADNVFAVNGAVAELSGHSCTDHSVGYRAPDGGSWVVSTADLVSALTDCSIREIDLAPDGNVILTVQSAEGIYLITVTDAGSVASTIRVGDLAARATTEIDANGVALVVYTRLYACPDDPSSNECSDVQLRGYQGSDLTISESWTGAAATLQRNPGGSLWSFIYLGPGQVGTWLYDAPRNTCGMMDNCGPFGSESVWATKAVPGVVPPREWIPGHAW